MSSGDSAWGFAAAEVFAGHAELAPWLLAIPWKCGDFLLACDEDRYRILSKSVRSSRSPVVGGRLVVRYRHP